MEKMPNNPIQTKLGECEGVVIETADCQTDMLCYQAQRRQGSIQK